jgi:ABC-type anion transport system duplicated permease subunit
VWAAAGFPGVGSRLRGLTAIPLLVAAVPILLVARVRVHVVLEVCVGALSSFPALVIFPLIGLGSLLLGDCI